MARSKKPRKKYKQRYLANPLRNYFPQHELDSILEFVDNLELQHEIGLPKGYCQQDFFDKMASLVNWGLVVRYSRDNLLDDESVRTIHEAQNGAVLALSQLKKRQLELKKENLVTTGEELKAIRAYADLIFPFLRECVTNTPERTFRELVIAQHLTDTADTFKKDELACKAPIDTVKNLLKETNEAKLLNGQVRKLSLTLTR